MGKLIRLLKKVWKSHGHEAKFIDLDEDLGKRKRIFFDMLSARGLRGGLQKLLMYTRGLMFVFPTRTMGAPAANL
jgi:hypothetical protein